MEKPNSRTEGDHTFRTDDVHYDESFITKSTTGLDEFYCKRQGRWIRGYFYNGCHLSLHELQYNDGNLLNSMSNVFSFILLSAPYSVGYMVWSVHKNASWYWWKKIRLYRRSSCHHDCFHSFNGISPLFDADGHVYHCHREKYDLKVANTNVVLSLKLFGLCNCRIRR